MFTYFQRTGGLVDPAGVHIATGYSGFRSGKNNPQMEEVKGVGPIPEGMYTIGEIIAEDGEHGPWVLPLTPHPGNRMFNRDEFLIHGDNKVYLGCASHGCIVVDRPTRLIMGESPDKILRVTA